MPVRFPCATRSGFFSEPSSLAEKMLPAKSVTNIRSPLKSRAIPIPSIRCVSKMSDVGCLAKSASIGARPRVAVAGVDQGFDIRTIQVRAHHSHSLAVAPVKFAALLLEMKLLRRECLAFANDGYAILAVEISALDRTVVLVRNAHVGPVNVSGFKIDDDAIRDSSSADNDFSLRPVGVSRMNPAAACFKKEQATNSLVRGCAFG